MRAAEGNKFYFQKGENNLFSLTLFTRLNPISMIDDSNLTYLIIPKTKDIYSRKLTVTRLLFFLFCFKMFSVYFLDLLFYFLFSTLMADPLFLQRQNTTLEVLTSSHVRSNTISYDAPNKLARLLIFLLLLLCRYKRLQM